MRNNESTACAHPRCKRAGECRCKLDELLAVLRTAASGSGCLGFIVDRTETRSVVFWTVIPDLDKAHAFCLLATEMTNGLDLNYFHPKVLACKEGWQVSMALVDRRDELGLGVRS